MSHMVLTTRGAMARHLRGERSGPGLLLMSSVLPAKTKAGIPIGTGTATGLDRMGAMAKLFWSSPLELFRSVVSPPSAEEAKAHRARAAFVFVQPDAAQLATLAGLADGKFIRPILADVLPLAQARKAQEQSEGGHIRGKLVLEVGWFEK
jgi:hypothetical protein